MPQRDMVSDLSAAVLLPAATYSADNTPAAVDLAGYEGVSIYLSIGVGGITFSGTNKIEFKLTHSDDNSTYTDVDDTDIIGAPTIADGIIKSLTAAHSTASVYEYGYKGGKRYLKLLADFSGTHGTGTPLGANVLRGFPLSAPVA